MGFLSDLLTGMTKAKKAKKRERSKQRRKAEAHTTKRATHDGQWKFGYVNAKGEESTRLIELREIKYENDTLTVVGFIEEFDDEYTFRPDRMRWLKIGKRKMITENVAGYVEGIMKAANKG
jgi:predicted DNA-binding transcriptional regulator YafY